MWWMPSSFRPRRRLAEQGWGPAALVPDGACDHRRVQDGSLIPRFGRARRDRALAVLEGFHPLKHALRFGAELELLVTPDPDALLALADRLAPDLRPRLAAEAHGGRPRSCSTQLAPLRAETGVMAIAARPAVDLRRAARGPGRSARAARGPPRPRQHGRLRAGRRRGRRGRGARRPAATTRGIRTRCAAPPGCTSPSRSPAWTTSRALEGAGRPLLGARPGRRGPLGAAALDPRAILAFGTERDGLSRRARRPRRRALQHPDARGRLEPEPRDLGRRRAVRVADGARPGR